METPKKRKLILFFTGFGKFGKVIENPTTFLSRSLRDLLTKDPIEGLELHETHVITVSIEDCDEALANIYQRIAEMMAVDEEDSMYIVLHMGVYQGSGKFNIELQGRNIKHFRIPDERGNKPLDQCIAEGFDISHCIQTRLAVDTLVGRLQDKGHNVSKSLSAGEYICNYTYFCSL